MATQGKPVLVVVGVGGMGQAIARRLGTGKTVLLADFNEATLDGVVTTLKGDGFDAHAQVVDVSSAESLASLAGAAAGLGPVMQLAHTAGLSPTQASVGAILAVDLVGVAQSLDAFGEVIAPGGAGVVIASMAGQTAQPLAPEQERALASTPTAELAGLDFASAPAVADPGQAYGLAKRANQLRVQAASIAWGKRGARINSISPGIISTPMGQQELAGESGGFMRAMIAASGTGRIGTPEDIVAAASFLLSPDATFITGADLLVDGGVIAALRNGALQMPTA